jgi:hypothetical protein
MIKQHKDTSVWLRERIECDVLVAVEVVWKEKWRENEKEW